MNGSRPLVMHVVYRFDVGGLENGIVNLMNRMPEGVFRHAIVALTECVPAFCERIARKDVDFISLHKPPGHGVRVYPELFRLFRATRPAIVHTRNLAALEAVVPAWAAKVPVRIHGEHGWDLRDHDGSRRKFRLIRRLYRPFVSHYVALSHQLENYLIDRVGVESHRIERICNGVDTFRFQPLGQRKVLAGSPFYRGDEVLVGAVGRLQAVKDQLTLVRAFAHAVAAGGGGADTLRLVLAGEGPLRVVIEEEIARAGIAERVWMAGERSDVPDIMNSLDILVLPSRGEGISNVILEAMASGLPVVATRVGGNSELVVEGETGALVPAGDHVAMADMILRYAGDRWLRQCHGAAGRQRVESVFSLDGMVDRYASLYASLLSVGGKLRPGVHGGGA